jgi:hypothetical protein
MAIRLKCKGFKERQAGPEEELGNGRDAATEGEIRKRAARDTERAAQDTAPPR